MKMSNRKRNNNVPRASNPRALGYGNRRFCPQPFPDEQFVTLKYDGEYLLTSTVGTGTQVMRINSAYDPDYTNVGYQPLGFDQWSGFYSKYVVYECDVVIRATARTSGGTLAVAAVPTVDTTIPSLEAAQGSRRSLYGTTTFGAVPLVMRKRYAICDVMGVSPASIDIDDAFAAQTIGGNPARPCYLHIVTETSGASDTFYLSVQLAMKVKLWLPNLIAASLSIPGVVTPKPTVQRPDSCDTRTAGTMTVTARDLPNEAHRSQNTSDLNFAVQEAMRHVAALAERVRVLNVALEAPP